MKKYYTRVCNFYYGINSQRLINKNVFPANKDDLKIEEEKEESALGSIGLKPKIVH